MRGGRTSIRQRCFNTRRSTWRKNQSRNVWQSKMPDECVILADGLGALVELCGISILERLLRTLQRCGITRATILSSTPKEISEELARPSWARAQLQLTTRQRPAGAVTMEQLVDLWPEATELLLVVRGDTVFDMRLLEFLSKQNRNTALID